MRDMDSPLYSIGDIETWCMFSEGPTSIQSDSIRSHSAARVRGIDVRIEI